MSKFKKEGKKGSPAISTASLPDIVFMLLFFFMVSTVMRETELLVQVSKPSATELTKVEKKSLVDYIYVGKAQNTGRYGEQPVIQLDGQIVTTIRPIRQWIKDNRGKREEAEKPWITTSLKIDKHTKMGIITDIKQELRKENALRMNYSANPGSVVE